MKTVFSPIQLHHNPAREFLDGAWVEYLESPRRAEMILKAVCDAKLGEVIPPDDFGLEPIRAVHAEHYLDYLQHAYERWIEQGGAATGVYPDTFFKPQFAPPQMPGHRPTKIGALAGLYTFDMSTVIVENTWQAAYRSAQCALTAARIVRDGERAAFALCRPPGHHAHADMGGGYCFLNNAAIAAEWLAAPLPSRACPELAEGGGAGAGVAILDIDFHHGNGTQAIFYRRDDVLFVSIHAHPDRQYPYFLGSADELGEGAGLGYNFNYPLEKGATNERYLRVLDRACERVENYRPRYLLVSLGVDTFGGDPLGDFALTAEAYPHIGARLARLNLPAAFVMEGGYAIDPLGQNVVNVLRGFEG
jgi:acetoin utilization deacetylase AcuC-like enzyme